MFENYQKNVSFLEDLLFSFHKKKNQTKLNSLLHLHAMLQMRLLSDFLTL